MIPDSQALDELHRHLAAWQQGAGSLTDEDINSSGGADPDPIDLASLKRGRLAAQFTAKPQPAGQSPAQTMGSPQGPMSPPSDAPSPPQSPQLAGSSPRSAMLSAVIGAKPPVSPASAPLGYSAPQDTELAALQDKTASDKRVGALGQAVTAFGERPTNQLDAIQQLGGVKPTAQPHNAMWDNAGAEGEQAIKDLQARRASSAGMAGASELNNPDSRSSVLMRSLFEKYAPDIVAKNPNLTAADGARIQPYMLKIVEEAAKRETELAKPKPEPRPGDPLEQAKLDEEKRWHDMQNAKPRGKGPAAAPAPQAEQDAGTRAKAIANGQVAPPSLRSPDYKDVMARVLKIDPNYDETKFHTYQHTRNEQATNSALNAGKAVRGHMDELKSAVDALDPGMIDSPLANRLAQGLAGSSGSNKYTRLQTAASVVGSELGQALGEHDQAGREHVKQLVRPDQTKEQWAQSLPELERLRDEKIGVSEKTIADLAPKKSGTPPPPDAREHKTLSTGVRVSRVPGGQWEADE